MSLIQLRISAAVAQSMFRLPEGVTMEGASVEGAGVPDGPRVRLHRRDPGEAWERMRAAGLPDDFIAEVLVPEVTA